MFSEERGEGVRIVRANDLVENVGVGVKSCIERRSLDYGITELRIE